MDCGPPSASRMTMRNLVSPPSAANTGAALETFAAATAARAPDTTLALLLRELLQIFLDELGLLGPALIIGGERLGPTLQRDLVEAGFGDRQRRAAGCLLQLECHERRRLLGVILAGVDGIRMPAEREHTHGLDALDEHMKRRTRVRDRKRTRLN